MPYKNPEDHKEKRKKYSRLFYLKNKKEINTRSKIYRNKNLEKEKLRAKKYYDTHKIEKHLARIKRRELRNLTERNRYQKIKFNPSYKLSKNIRTRLYLAVKKNYKRGSAVKDLGCSIDIFKNYLESKFKKGMTWKNWGKNGWHIDHIRPLKSFDLLNKEEFLQAVNYKNLQPLWAKENMQKGKKYDSTRS